jgi:hypothetical protein
VAAKTKKEAAAAFDMSVYQLNQWSSVTGNAEEVEMATSKPGQLFVREMDSRPHYWHATLKAATDARYLAKYGKRR